MSDPAMSTMEHSHSPDGSNKRKRDDLDSGEQRLNPSVQGQNNTNNGSVQGSGASHYDMNMQATENFVSGYDGMPNNGTDLSQIDRQLLQAVHGQNGVSEESAMTAKAALAAHQPESKYPPPEPAFDSNSLGGNLSNNLGFPQDVNQGQMQGQMQGHNSTAAAVYAAREAQAQAQAQQINPKPSVGSAEWHQIRKNNHKEVERRRRETINEGINEIAKMVPGCEKAKGSILQRAIQYIAKLQEDAKEMAARFDTTNMTTNQAIAEISSQNSKLKVEVNRRGDVAHKWIQRCREAGLEFDDYDDEKDLTRLDIDENHQM